MSDIADQASQLEEHNITVALANIQKPEPRATECRLCGDDALMPGSNYCSPGCCRKHEIKMRRAR